jgi:hypothetical protein
VECSTHNSVARVHVQAYADEEACAPAHVRVCAAHKGSVQEGSARKGVQGNVRVMPVCRLNKCMLLACVSFFLLVDPFTPILVTIHRVSLQARANTSHKPKLSHQHFMSARSDIYGNFARCDFVRSVKLHPDWCLHISDLESNPDKVFECVCPLRFASGKSIIMADLMASSEDKVYVKYASHSKVWVKDGDTWELRSLPETCAKCPDSDDWLGVTKCSGRLLAYGQVTMLILERLPENFMLRACPLICVSCCVNRLRDAEIDAFVRANNCCAHACRPCIEQDYRCKCEYETVCDACLGDGAARSGDADM